jgi:Ca2+/Na+ antiporter
MIPSLITLIVIALVLFILWWLLAKVAPEPIRTVIGVILALIFLVYVLHTFKLLN